MSTAVGTVGKNGSAGNGLRFKAWGVGSGLSASELAVYENHIQSYMQARGIDDF